MQSSSVCALLTSASSCCSWDLSEAPGEGMGRSRLPGIFYFVSFSLKGGKEDIPPCPRTGPTKRDLEQFSTA